MRHSERIERKMWLTDWYWVQEICDIFPWNYLKTVQLISFFQWVIPILSGGAIQIPSLPKARTLRLSRVKYPCSSFSKKYESEVLSGSEKLMFTQLFPWSHFMKREETLVIFWIHKREIHSRVRDICDSARVLLSQRRYQPLLTLTICCSNLAMAIFWFSWAVK